MNVLSKIVSFLAVFCIFDAANAALRAGGGASGAATARVSVATTPGAVASAAARRIPTMTMTATAQDTTGGAALASTTECVESYSECIKGNDACGSDFEECTTRELFYAQMPKCNSVLMQCSSAGVNALFGTTSMSSLTIENIDSLPKAGSIIDQYITAGEIMNRLDTGQCVQRYLRCLHGDSVCGEEFELCTTNAEFKKQKVFCESTLARCQDEGKKELFGSVDTTQYPAADSRLATMIAEGLEMAAVNAVQTCFKVADACILNACRDNPLRCIADTNLYLKDLGDVISTGNTSVPPKSEDASTTITQKEVKAHMRNACFETIGANPSCHMTAGDNKGKMPKASDLRDEYKRDEVFTAVYDLRKNAVAEKLAQLRDEFDKEARDKCAKTIADCAVRSCGDGSGPACYSSAFKTSGEPMSVNNPKTRKYIKAGCELIVNTDPNCQYAAVSSDDILKAFAYNYNGNGAFDTLFPERTSESDTNDPINVVAALNASLQENYNDSAIADLAKQCKQTVRSCIQSKCGADYAKCYRNRGDIMSDTYGADSGLTTAQQNSMNKVSGILDFTIIRGLCGTLVNESEACEEHLNIQKVKAK